jgi:ABC-2 type transport system ATP-binding protein
VAGFDVVKEPREAKRRIGWISSEIIIDDELAALENLEIQARLHGVSNWRERALQLLRYFGLVEAAGRPVGKFSRGCGSASKWPQPSYTGPRYFSWKSPLLV